MEQQVSRGFPYKWIAIVTVSFGTFLVTLDTSLIPISLPKLGEVFQVGPTTVLWVALIYTLVGTGLMLTFGRLGDALGHKRVYTIGVIIFTLGLGLCALAQNMAQLLLFRLVQAIGHAMIITMSNAIVTASFPARERGKALGTIGAVSAAGMMIGWPIGGFLLDTLGWQSIFYVRLPIGIIGSAMAWALLREESSHNTRPKLDVWGAVTLFGGLASLLLVVNQGQARGWTSFFVLGLGIAGLVLLALFLVVEKRTREPVVDLRLFRNRIFAAATSSYLIYFLGSAAVIFLMPFYLIQGIGYSSSQAGWLLLTVWFLGAVIAPLSGRLYDRVGPLLPCSTGLGLVCLGLFMLSRLSGAASISEIVLGLAVLGLGRALFIAPDISAMMGSVTKERLGTASATIATTRQIGMSSGMAIAGAIFASRQLFHATELGTSGLEQGEIHRLSLIAGFQDALLVSLFFCGLALLVSLLSGGIGRPEREREEPLPPLT